MSLILDALNRSQRERDSGRQVPGIDTQHWVEPLPSRPGWLRSLPWFALALALGVIAWLALRGQPPAPPVVPAAPPVSEPVRAVVQQPVESVPHPPSAVEAGDAGPGVVGTGFAAAERREPDPAVAELYGANLAQPGADAAGLGPKPAARAVPASSSGERAPTGAVGSAGGSATTRPSRANDTAAAAAGQAPSSDDAEQTIDIEKMVALAQREAENVGIPEHPVPFLAALSQQTKDKIPTIYYTEHKYSSDRAQSSVTLNGEVVTEGRTVAGNLQLVEILPQSIVLDYRGTQFRLRALNSWINL